MNKKSKTASSNAVSHLKKKKTPKASVPVLKKRANPILVGTANGTESEDADALLKRDHRQVEQLFAEYHLASDLDDKQRLSSEICSALIVHTILEEELFYPECRLNNVDSSSLCEAQVEHDSAKILITELMQLPVDSPYYDAKVKVLSEYIKHHVGEEEKLSDGIFARARKAGVDMTALGMRLQLFKKELLAEGESIVSQPPVLRALETNCIFFNSHHKEYQTMAENNDQKRGNYGRYSGYENESYPDESYGQESYDENRNRSRHSSSQYRDRDEYGRFMSDDERRGNRGGYSGYSQERSGGGYSRNHDDDRRRDSGSYRNDDDYGSSSGNYGQGHQGWYGDPQGHSEAARRGSRNREGGSSDYNEHNRSNSNQRGGQGHQGWYGDPEGHSEAARRGWKNR